MQDDRKSAFQPTIEDRLHVALAQTFPASDPIALRIASRVDEREPERLSRKVGGRDETGPRHSQEYYRTIFDEAGFAIWETNYSGALLLAEEAIASGVTDLKSWYQANIERVREVAVAARINDANDAAARLFGVPDRASLVDLGFVHFRTPASESALPHIFATLHAGERMAEGETRFRTMSGDIIDVMFRVTLPPDHDGWRRVLVMALDISEWHRTQARLTAALAELAHASRISILGQLAASIAHEVNQPLSAIITYGKSGKRWLTREVPDAKEVADCLDHVVTNGQRAADIIGRIRALARKAQTALAPVDIEGIVDDSVALLRRDLFRHAVELQLRVTPDLAPALADRVQVQQVVMNLLLNAIQAMAQVDGERRELLVEIGREGEMLRLGVHDRGPGFGDLDPKRIFDPFFTTKSEGMGIGLSICRSIVESHGGSIAAENRDGGGASICLLLPVATQETSAVT